MATLITGISTSGLASSPLPHVAWNRNDDHRPGEYKVQLNATSSVKLELILQGDTLHHLVSHLVEIDHLIDDDLQKWRRDWHTLRELATTGVDLSSLNPNPRSNTPT